MAVNSFNAQNPPLTTKGDLFTFSTIPTRLGVGSNDQVLIADSSTATGLKWGSASATDNFQLLNAGGTALTGATTITVSGISNKNKLFIRIEGASSVNASAAIRMQFNGDSTSKYGKINLANNQGTIDAEGGNVDSDTKIELGKMGNSAANTVRVFATLEGANAAGLKILKYNSFADGTGTQNSAAGTGVYSGTSTISSVSLISSSGNFDAGTIYIYGA